MAIFSSSTSRGIPDWRLVSVVAGLVLIVGALLSQFVESRFDAAERQKLLDLATTVAASFNPAHVESLSGTSADVGTDFFDGLRLQLTAIRKSSPDYRFVYLMRLQENTVTFLADGEPEDSEDYSAPGDVYDEASAELLQIFADGRPFIEGPITDRWGRWISGHAAVLNSEGSIVAIVGIDHNAMRWERTVARVRYTGWGLTILMAVLTASVFALYHRQLGNQRALRESEELTKAILNTSFQLQGLLKPDGTLIEANSAALSMVGHSREDIVGLLFWESPWWAHDPDIQIRLREAVEQAARGETVQFLAMHPAIDGGLRHIDFRITPIKDENGNVEFIVPEGHDITELKRTEEALRESEERLKHQVVELTDREERLEAQAAELVALAENLEAAKQEMQHLANYDALTGLPSLRLCKDRLESALAADRRNKSQTAVLFIDLDGFKAVNDSMGHEAGDVVLKGVAERLKSSVRERDTAARIGGDEFILVLPETGDKDAASKVAQKVIGEMSKPFPIDGGIARIGASIGIAISPADGSTSDELLRHADESMYAIKNRGKNNYGFFA
jgi:diguanylate cyclase (GGDEF)-like protein/PAS domain S-box-containing protein